MLKIVFIFSLLLWSCCNCYATTIIRDAEMENYLHNYSRDIFLSSGLEPDRVKIIILSDDSPNAFVAGGMNIFIHTGLIKMCDSPEELVGVIAHETGHISGGHLATASAEIGNTYLNSLYSLLLATAVGVASQNAEAGSAVLMASNETLRGNYLYYTRTQEATADVDALKYLKESRISVRGLFTFLKKLEEQSLLPETAQSEYLQTHPLSKKRIEAVEYALSQEDSSVQPLDSKPLQIIKDKIEGYVNPRRLLAKYKNDNSFSKEYARAIAYYRVGEKENSLKILNELIAENKNNPYLYELKGQVLRDFGQIADSIEMYKKANELVFSPLIKVSYAQAMLDSNDNKYLNEVISNLLQSLRIERSSLSAWQLLATAYKRDGNEGMFRLSSAEADLLSGDLNKAKFNVNKAIEIFKNEKKACQRCLDIVDFIELKNRKE